MTLAITPKALRTAARTVDDISSQLAGVRPTEPFHAIATALPGAGAIRQAELAGEKLQSELSALGSAVLLHGVLLNEAARDFTQADVSGGCMIAKATSRASAASIDAGTYVKLGLPRTGALNL